MFVRQHQNQFRTANADVQMFYASMVTASQPQLSWNKPTGVSHVYIMLIGAGAGGDGAGTGGGSGAVSVWYGAARNVPDNLLVQVDRGNNGQRTAIFGKFAGSAFTELLRASSASSFNGGIASTGISAMEAMGFYQSVAGQDGNGGVQVPSATTFLSGGSNTTARVDANYGYTSDDGRTLNGGTAFFLQPIIVGIGGGTASPTRTAIGCGANSNYTTGGGNGFALIASW